jgi:hypothetical protein
MREKVLWLIEKCVFGARGLGIEKSNSLYTRVRWVKGLDVFWGNRRGISFGRSRLAKFWNWVVTPEVNLTPSTS